MIQVIRWHWWLGALLVAIAVATSTVGGWWRPDPAAALVGRWRQVGEGFASDPLGLLAGDHLELRGDGALARLMHDQGQGAFWVTQTGSYTLDGGGQITIAGFCWRGMERYDCARRYRYTIIATVDGDRLRIADIDASGGAITFARVGPAGAEFPPTLQPPSATPALPPR